MNINYNNCCIVCILLLIFLLIIYLNTYNNIEYFSYSRLKCKKDSDCNNPDTKYCHNNVCDYCRDYDYPVGKGNFECPIDKDD